jgi:hypothetical protein
MSPSVGLALLGGGRSSGATTLISEVVEVGDRLAMT